MKKWQGKRDRESPQLFPRQFFSFFFGGGDLVLTSLSSLRKSTNRVSGDA